VGESGARPRQDCRRRAFDAHDATADGDSCPPPITVSVKGPRARAARCARARGLLVDATGKGHEHPSCRCSPRRGPRRTPRPAATSRSTAACPSARDAARKAATSSRSCSAVTLRIAGRISSLSLAPPRGGSR
jgi:hypothetical protein